MRAARSTRPCSAGPGCDTSDQLSVASTEVVQIADEALRARGPPEHRLARGGSWFNEPALLRSALRAGEMATNQFNNLGFRIARDVR